MRKGFLKTLYSLAVFIQLLILSSVCIVEFLTTKKAGVMHHVFAKRYQFKNGYFSVENMMIQNVAIIILLGVFLILLIWLIKRRNNLFLKVQGFLVVVISTVILSFMFINKLEGILSYYYFLSAFYLILLIQIIIFICAFIYNKHNN